MPIDLGLARVVKLLKHLGNPHQAYHSVHVAGTNGKGSTLAYVSSILTQSGVRNGRFTSPHMLYYNDCITIDEKVYPLSKFDEVSRLVSSQNSALQLGCTEFELLTATAYKIFELEKVALAVIEVGLGGRLDATNVLEPPTLLATGITKIALDHESFLGGTLAAIASEKAGIIKTGVPCVADSTNTEEVLDVIVKKAEEMGSKLYIEGQQQQQQAPVDGGSSGGSSVSAATSLIAFSPLKGAYQLQNLSVALKLVDILASHESYRAAITAQSIASGVKATVWKGRLQTVSVQLSKDSDESVDVLLDGAHNESAAIELGKFLNTLPGRSSRGLVFVIAMTKGKNIDSLFKHLLTSPQDSVILTGFSTPENMPWIKNATAEELGAAAKRYTANVYYGEEDERSNIQTVLAQASKLAGGTKGKGTSKDIVVCGSLYLCSDVLRLAEA